LLVVLQQFERREIVRSSDKARVAHLECEREVGQRQTAAIGCVNSVELSLQVLEPDTIAETPGNEVDAGNLRVRDVLAFIHRKTRLTVRHEGVLEIAEPVKRVNGRAQLEVSPCQKVRFCEGCAEAAGILGEGWRYQHGCLKVLVRSFAIQKIKDLVLDDWPAQAPAILGPLKRLRESGRSIHEPGS